MFSFYFSFVEFIYCIALPEGSGSMLCLLTGQYLCTLGPPAIVSGSI